MSSASDPAVALTVAGTDSGGAAGIAADLTTFAALGVHGACAVTAVTAQDTTGVHAVAPIDLEVVAAQIRAVIEDLPVAAVKTGMLGSADVVALVADLLASRPDRPLVVDPVLVATSGAVLGDEVVVVAYREHLLPVTAVLTPNVDEAHALLGDDLPPARAARVLSALGPAVVITGGGSQGTCTDWLSVDGAEALALTHRAVPTSNDHGSGCTFSAALAARLALGDGLLAAVRAAGRFTTDRLHAGRHHTLGRGRGPVDHTHPPTQEVPA